MRKWEELQDNPDMPIKFYDVIQAGLDKLAEYEKRADDVPAYVIAMGEFEAF